MVATVTSFRFSLHDEKEPEGGEIILLTSLLLIGHAVYRSTPLSQMWMMRLLIGHAVYRSTPLSQMWMMRQRHLLSPRLHSNHTFYDHIQG